MHNYTMTLWTEAPVFIGDGGKISKKEYIFVPGQQLVHVPDMVKMYQDFESRHLLEAYEEYLLRDKRDFAAWLKQNKILQARRIPHWVAYSIDSSGAVFEDRGKKEILTFIKDAYGCPYIPGSSIKGMLRTVLLSALLLKNRDKLKDEIQNVRRAELRGSRMSMLKRETDGFEQRCLHTLNRPGTERRDKVNDMMSGLRVSDSRPLRTDDLILCQKLDISTEGKQRKLPILRECLRPGTEVVFNLTLTDAFRFSAEQLLQAAERCQAAYDACFRSAFHVRDIQREGTVYLGGGSGYATKTFTYPLLGQKPGVDLTSRIMNKITPTVHGHRLDKQKGVSPHMLKCTQYRGKIYEMGACSIAIKEEL